METRSSLVSPSCETGLGLFAFANTRLVYPLRFELMMSDCQQVASRFESWTNRAVSYVFVQPCLSTCGVQVWTTGTVVDDEGECHAGSCQWTGRSEGRALGLD
jgi:hypothetical protein